MSENMLVQVDKVSRIYREAGEVRSVLTEISLGVMEGECLALVGRSGSGKTTLLNLISGIDLPDAGSINVDGHNLGDLSERERTLFRRQHIGFVFQFFNLIPTLTVAENVALPLELNNHPEAAIRQRVRLLLGKIGLADRERAFPDQLSGGEQQRVAIARALAHEPALVLADEPTGNLDAKTGAHILDLLTGLSDRRGQTLVLVTHSPEVASYASRIVTLNNGKLVATAGNIG